MTDARRIEHATPAIDVAQLHAFLQDRQIAAGRNGQQARAR
jgi:hypothetical protein